MTRTPSLRATIPVVALLAAAALGACGGDRSAPAADTTATAAAPAGSDTAAVAAAAVHVEHERAVDLTGDGAPERILVTADGPRPESLAVRLEIRGADGAPLHVVRWNTRDYFKYDSLAALTPDSVDRRVRAELARVVADDAFGTAVAGGASSPDVPLDSGTIAYELGELRWRREHALADSLPLPPDAHSDIGDYGPPDAATRERIERLAAELRGRPTFRYFTGGEATYVVAWSPTERRFVRVFACC